MSRLATIGFPPKAVTRLLRLEGAAALLASLFAYGAVGGNWWLFALLLLLPDIALLAVAQDQKRGAKVYNLAHTYVFPALLAALGLALNLGWAVPLALIWTAHIGMDRALGYGLKYPWQADHTHLGPMGKAKHLAHAS